QGGEAKRTALDFDEDVGDGVRVAQRIERDPECGLHLARRGRRSRLRWYGKDERRDHDRGQPRRLRCDLVERAEERSDALQRNAHLLLGLATGGMEQVTVAGGTASAGQRDMTRPWIAPELGAADQEQLERGTRPDQERDCCFLLFR